LGQVLENFSKKSKDLFANLNQLDVKAPLINDFSYYFLISSKLKQKTSLRQNVQEDARFFLSRVLRFEQGGPKF
jgi:hypothetical protein